MSLIFINSLPDGINKLRWGGEDLISRRSEGLDVITVEVVRNYLISIAEEMKKTIIRTSMSPIIYEVLDFSTGVFDRRSRLIAQASGLAIFLGTLDWAVKAVLDKYGESNLKPGDIFLTNDPYEGGGTHLNDVAMVKPIFYREALVGFTGVRAHWLDVGGKVAFSQMTDATEIYQEGLQFPIIKLCDAEVMNEALVETIKANVREPRLIIGDMNAQIAACKVGERRYLELVDKYGLDFVEAAMGKIMEDSDLLTRKELEDIPDGVYHGEDFLDSDAVTDEPRRVAVKIEKQGSDITFDYSASDEATRSSYNLGYCALVSAARVLLKAITSPQTPINDGCFRPLTVLAREGSLVNARRPSPVCMYGELSDRVAEAAWKALAPVIPERLPAGHYGTVCAQGLAGWDDRFDPPCYAMHGGPNAGGWGASHFKDGENALICLLNGDTRNTPVEIIEAKNPLRVLRYALVEDSGGPGRFRGGLGTVIEYEVTTALDFVALFVLERVKFKPFGLHGGWEGAGNDAYVLRDGELFPNLGKVTGFQLQKGDVVTVVAGGGGGYGNPQERDPEKIREDVKKGYVSLEKARDTYKTEIHESDGPLHRCGVNERKEGKK